MQPHYPKYKYEVHIAGYGGIDWSTLPKPFFVNEVSPPNVISTIVTAELKEFTKALELFEKIRKWCDSQEVFHQQGCRITLEEMVKIKGMNSSLDKLPIFENREWQINDNAFIPFSDVHADGLWNNALYASLVKERGYIPLDYTTRTGRRLSVLTLHFLYPDFALREANYLKSVLAKGGFQGTLSVENTLAVAVIGPAVTRPVVVDKIIG